jgi:hypothetical protein
MAGKFIQETDSRKISDFLRLGSRLAVGVLCQILRSDAIETGPHGRIETAFLDSVS